MHIFTGRETEIRLRGKAGIEKRCWQSKSSALFAVSHSLLRGACINRAWQSLKHCWVYPYNASMKYWCFAYTGGILKQICVCILGARERATYTHTDKRREKHIVKSDPLGKKKTCLSLNIHLLALLSWAPNVPSLICGLLTWGPGLQ